LRMALKVTKLPAGTVIRFQGSEDDSAYEVTGDEILEAIESNVESGDKGPEARLHWSPVLEGASATIEIEIPSIADLRDLRIAIPSISHLVTSIRTDFVVPKAAAACEQDVMCSPAWSNESNAVARIVFSSGGSSYLCSGTLLADSDTTTVIPYFLTANHCISTQTIASTLMSYWFYRSTACNSGVLGPYKSLSGGAALL